MKLVACERCVAIRTSDPQSWTAESSSRRAPPPPFGLVGPLGIYGWFSPLESHRLLHLDGPNQFILAVKSLSAYRRLPELTFRAQYAYG